MGEMYLKGGWGRDLSLQTSLHVAFSGLGSEKGWYKH
nr:unnamed protein product [Callosobruchus analis]